MKEFYVSCILVEAYKVYQVGKGEKQEQRHEDVKTKGHNLILKTVHSS